MKASRIFAIIVVLVVFPATVWAQQQTVRACVKNANGQVRIVGSTETCLPSERLVEWVSGGAGPVVVPPPTTPPPAPNALRVLDANGSLFGMLAGPGVVARQVGDTWVGLPVSSIGFQLSDTLFTYYKANDCGGDAYMQLDMMSALRTAVVMKDAAGHLTASYPGTPEVVNTTMVSWGAFSGGTFTCWGPYQPVSWAPMFGKAATPLDVTNVATPFKIVQ